ncbi:unnamed protein product [Laminaria digitata]
MYPKDRLPRSKTQMPPNLVALFAHVMSRANEGGRGSAAHSWDEVLTPAPVSSSSSASDGGSPTGPCPMSAQDWRKAEAFSVHLQSLIAARHTRCNSSLNGTTGRGGGAGGGGSGYNNNHNGNIAPFSTTAAEGGGRSSSSAAGSASVSSARSAAAASISSVGKGLQLSNGGKVKGKTKPQALQASQAGSSNAAPSATVSSAGAGAGVAATPNPAPMWTRNIVPRVTPKEPSRAGEPSAPLKVVGRIASSRRVNGDAEGAVASLAVSRAGPGAFETPSHSSYHAARAGPPPADSSFRGREHSPSRYPARLRSRRFPQLGSSRESPEPPQPRGFGHGGAEGAGGDGDQTQGGRRLSPRNSHPSLLAREDGRGFSSDHGGSNARDWRVAAAEGGGSGCAAFTQLGHRNSNSSSGDSSNNHHHHHHHHNHHNDGDGDDDDDGGGGGGGDGQSYGMRTRTAPKAVHDLGVAMASPSGTCTPQMPPAAVASPSPMDFRQAPPPIVAATAAGASGTGTNSRAEVPAKPRQVLQGGRSGGRVPPVPRSSVGGRNYTDNHVKQLGLIEAAVVASATVKDRAMYNLPRQGRTLTLTNVFKFIALRGAGVMYSLATEKQVEAHTGRHSNFFDGKIDARIVSIIKRDIGDEAITKSRKFSKILLSLIAEGCSHPDCGWDHSSFTSVKIANMQARMEAETGTSVLQCCSDPASSLGAAAAAGGPSSPLGPGASFSGAAGSSGGGQANCAHSKRRLDLGKDDAGQTPSPRLKKLKRAARVRLTGSESTPTGDGIGGSSKSPPKEEDDMRAAEVLQGLKGVGGPSG